MWIQTAAKLRTSQANPTDERDKERGASIFNGQSEGTNKPIQVDSCNRPCALGLEYVCEAHLVIQTRLNKKLLRCTRFSVLNLHHALAIDITQCGASNGFVEVYFDFPIGIGQPVT